jgi:hypothetical protein
MLVCLLINQASRSFEIGLLNWFKIQASPTSAEGAKWDSITNEFETLRRERDQALYPVKESISQLKEDQQQLRTHWRAWEAWALSNHLQVMLVLSNAIRANQHLQAGSELPAGLNTTPPSLTFTKNPEVTVSPKGDATPKATNNIAAAREPDKPNEAYVSKLKYGVDYNQHLPVGKVTSVSVKGYEGYSMHCYWKGFLSQKCYLRVIDLRRSETSGDIEISAGNPVEFTVVRSDNIAKRVKFTVVEVSTTGVYIYLPEASP